MNGRVFVENGLRGAAQWGDKDAGHLADGQTVKNCAIQKHRCLAIYTQSLWGLQKCIFLRIYMATARLNVKSAYKRGCTGTGKFIFLRFWSLPDKTH